MCLLFIVLIFQFDNHWNFITLTLNVLASVLIPLRLEMAQWTDDDVLQESSTVTGTRALTPPR
jgi:hypothetical protein